MPPSDITEKVATMAFGDSKKAKAIRHGATMGGSIGAIIAFMWMYPNAVPGYVDAQDAKAKTDTVVASATKIDSMEKRVDRLEQKQDQGNVWLMQLLAKQGVTPIILPASNDSTIADTSKTRPR